jgi:hypothetical protein
MPLTPDQINGMFEFVGGILLWMNCVRLYKDRELKGVSWFPVVFFTTWGYWNLYFYPSMNAWWSFYGGIFIVSANTTWIMMLFYFKWNKKKSEQNLPV